MVGKTDFAPAEWKKVLESPLLAGFAMTAADPSSFVGSLQEAFAEARSLAEAKTGGSGLIKAIVEELLTSSGRADAREGIRTIAAGATSAGQIKERALEALKEATAILDQKAPDEAKTVKTWLGQIAKTVAEAGTEGGFLGFGGIKVSDKEKATLSEISKILGV